VIPEHYKNPPEISKKIDASFLLHAQDALVWKNAGNKQLYADELAWK
jgi:hypothetical protein